MCNNKRISFFGGVLMGIVSKMYINKFLCRFDKEVGVPYYAYTDFLGLHQEQSSFINSKGIEIHYSYYYYDNYKTDKLVLFVHGLGPGHTAYLAEIEALAKHGYKILTLDYTGCGESKGKYLASLNNPTGDVIDLLNLLKIKTPIVLVGHSLGAFTSLNIIHLRKEITKAVMMSGFLSASSLIRTAVKSKMIASSIEKYERKTNPTFYKLDNLSYLKNTTDDLLFIQSDDDQVVPYSIGLKVVEQISNPHIKIIKETGKKHNPNYTAEAVKYMNDTFGKYYRLIKEKKIKTDEEKIAYFKDVSLPKLVEQDEKIITAIVDFIG